MGSGFRHLPREAPPVPTRSKTISYTNSCISEYMACKDFYEIMIRERKEQIIDCGMAQLMESREHRFDGPRLGM